jgi:ABC-2 type transport system permease protein
MAQLIPNFDSAAAYVNAVFLPMIFISGTFYESKHLPAVLDAIARVLPLRHVIDGLRGSIVRGSGLTHHVEGLVVLAAWCAGGVFLSKRFFRWE